MGKSCWCIWSNLESVVGQPRVMKNALLVSYGLKSIYINVPIVKKIFSELLLINSNNNQEWILLNKTLIQTNWFIVTLFTFHFIYLFAYMCIFLKFFSSVLWPPTTNSGPLWDILTLPMLVLGFGQFFTRRFPEA